MFPPFWVCAKRKQNRFSGIYRDKVSCISYDSCLVVGKLKDDSVIFVTNIFEAGLLHR